MTDWQERADAIMCRRVARGAATSGGDLRHLLREAVDDLKALEGTGEEYNPNRGFDYAEDVARYPFSWWPAEPVRISMSVPTVCSCGAPVRTLKPSARARPRYCARCLEPHGLEPEPLKLEREGDPVRVAALYLPGLADALDSHERPKPKKRGAYTIEQKREAVRLYRDTNMTMPEVAEKLGVPLASVKNWIRRYQDDPYFAS